MQPVSHSRWATSGAAGTLRRAGRLFEVVAALAAATLSVAAAADPGSWEQRQGYRVARLTVTGAGRTGFTLLTADQTAVWFTNSLSYDRSLANQNLLNGAGVAAGDYDGDGLCDFYLCNLEGRNALFRNLGNWRFEDVTLRAGVACTNQSSRGAAFADLNGDGWLDLMVTSLAGPNACLLNDGRGRFNDVTEAAGLVLPRAGCESLAHFEFFIDQTRLPLPPL